MFTCCVSGVTSVPPVKCWSLDVTTAAPTWFFHWLLKWHWRHCWFKLMSTPLVNFSIWSLPPHDGHVLLNNWSRRSSFTIHFPFIFRSVALKNNKTLGDRGLSKQPDVKKVGKTKTLNTNVRKTYFSLIKSMFTLSCFSWLYKDIKASVEHDTPIGTTGLSWVAANEI